MICLQAMNCDLFQQGICRSCTRLPEPYEQQLEAKHADLLLQLGDLPVGSYLPAMTGAEKGFRNKAKMAVTGTSDAPVLGIVDSAGQGIDLRACPLYPDAFAPVFNVLVEFIRRAGLQPYQIVERTGELKFILLTQSSATQQFLLRFVLRSTEQLDQIRQQLDWLQQQLPQLAVISVNIQPVPMAIIEGDEEIVLSETDALYEEWNGVPLFIRPRCFFQTNAEVAAKLYATARQWSHELEPTSIWDLFCGVGGFGLHCANKDTQLTGIEISAEAIASAKQSAEKLALTNIEFKALPSADFAANQLSPPDLLIANPPRRGLGKDLCEYLQKLQPTTIIYSSCNAKSLASDIHALPDYRVERVQLFDMFPHTDHYEILVLLINVGAGHARDMLTD
jgi:23S rRNA (uracil747-C5)-methyltransferase